MSSIKFAEELGAEYVLIHGGRIYHDYLVWERIVSESWGKYLTNIESIRKRAEDYNIPIVIENTTPSNNSNLIDNINALQKLIEELEKIQLVVDIGHLNLTSNVYDIEKAIRNKNFVEHLTGFHIHNNDGKRDLHQNYNKGQINYDRLKKNVFSKLKEKIYIAEVNTVEEGLEFKNFLEKVN